MLSSADAFRAAFVRHYPAVHRLLLQITRDRHEAEDLSQEVFVALHRQDFDPTREHDVGRWLLRVALNRGLNAVRAHKRRERRESRPDPRESLDPEETLARRTAQARVRSVLAGLEPRAAKLLTLRQLGMSYAEVAEVIDVNPSSVGTLLARAQRAFAAAYEERFGAPQQEEIS